MVLKQGRKLFQSLFKRSYAEAISEKKFRPVGSPLIEPQDNKKNSNFFYKATFETFPEIKLKGLDKIKLEKPEVDISDKDLNGDDGEA